MRLFLAIECPADIRDALADEALEAARFAGMAKVAADNIHLTLQFLGEADQMSAQQIIAALDGIRHAPFDVTVSGVGVFPNPRMPRVIWAGLSAGGAEVESLERAISATLQPLGFSQDGRFHPHLTLGRIKSVQDKGGLKAYLEAKKTTGYGAFRVSDYALIESRLSQGGPHYLKIKNFPLR